MTFNFQVDRKLVKQTVMTSVYGVTFVGAREQIKRRLQEKGQISDDRLLFKAACYAAKVRLYQRLGNDVKLLEAKLLPLTVFLISR